MTEKVFLHNTIDRREYYLPGGTHVCRIVYDYPYVHCTVYCLGEGDEETYDADKRHPKWQHHVQMFETLAWEKHRLIEEQKRLLEEHRNRQAAGSSQ